MNDPPFFHNYLPFKNSFLVKPSLSGEHEKRVGLFSLFIEPSQFCQMPTCS